MSKAQSPKSNGVVVPNAPTFPQRLGAWVIFLFIRALEFTLRCRWIDRSGFFDKPPVSPAIYCIWHNRLALCMTSYHGYVKRRTVAKNLAALISASKDGGFLAAILERFGVQPVRGSSSRRGRQALLELTTWTERGYDIAITPDGPRGPCYEVQDGVMALAQLTGLAIVPVTHNLRWKIRLKSWDRFQIPLPFSVCEMIFEKPIFVPRDATVEQREVLRQELEATLKRIAVD
jgi:lysophospholipid acyltransferase (LPLAT)-like uncharacterized protein